MPIEIYGNTQGLNHLIKRRLTSLYKKRLEPSAVITADLARQIMDISKETSRQIGLIINRRGTIERVIVGDNHRIEIPPLSTERTGRARFRGVRFIHTHLRGELLSREDSDRSRPSPARPCRLYNRDARRTGRNDPCRVSCT